MVIFAFEKIQSGRKEVNGFDVCTAGKIQKEWIKLVHSLGPTKWRLLQCPTICDKSKPKSACSCRKCLIVKET